jgi:NlpC/P60 family/Bacterial dipeptidyl-peptidase Sh3 domain
MVSIAHLQRALPTGQFPEYQCQATINLYKSPELQGLVTQAIAGRQLYIKSVPVNEDGKIAGLAMQVCLCEDDYPGWLALEDIDLLSEAEEPYQAIALTENEIRDRLPTVIAFAYAAMNQPNHYLWGGTTGPNYDCSGLTQTAFASAGIWLPRDSYQQEAFVQPIAIPELKPGDLVFFGTSERCNHVGIYLGEEHYIHSSGKDQGRNGIGIDRLSDQGDSVSRAYYCQFRGAGRVIVSYQPQMQT